MPLEKSTHNRNVAAGEAELAFPYTMWQKCVSFWGEIYGALAVSGRRLLFVKDSIASRGCIGTPAVSHGVTLERRGSRNWAPAGQGMLRCTSPAPDSRCPCVCPTGRRVCAFLRAKSQSPRDKPQSFLSEPGCLAQHLRIALCFFGLCAHIASQAGSALAAARAEALKARICAAPALRDACRGWHVPCVTL